MAVNKIVYNTEDGAQTLIDLTNDSVTPETLAKGVTAHDASGEMIVGTLDAKSDTMVGIWIFNEVLELHNFNFSLNFVLPNVADSHPFHTIYTMGDDLLCVDEYEDYHTPYENGVWVLPDWRTITITEEPTDAECIAWLKANAGKLGYDEGYEKGYDEGYDQGYAEGSASCGDDTMVGIWIFNEVLDLPEFDYYFNFVLTNVADSLQFYNIYSMGDGALYYFDVEDNDTVPYENGAWIYPEYRTITITEEPTDAECIAWLKANARKANYEDGIAEGEKAILSTYVDWSVSTTSNSCVVNVNNDNDYYAHIHLYVEEITTALDYDVNIVVPPFETFEIYQGEMGLDDLSGAEWFVLVTIERFSKDGV